MFYVYCVYSGNRTYIGYTNNLPRRLRQHCGHIKGGARATSCRTDWQFLFYITSADWTTISRACQVEWFLKHPTRERRTPSKFRGVAGKWLALQAVCSQLTEELHVYMTPKSDIDAALLGLSNCQFHSLPVPEAIENTLATAPVLPSEADHIF